MDWSIITLSATVGGIFGALALYFLGMHQAIGRIAALEGDFSRLKGQMWGQQGRAKQIGQGEDMEAATAEVALLMKSGKPLQEAIMEVATKYPSLVGQMIKKYMK